MRPWASTLTSTPYVLDPTTECNSRASSLVYSMLPRSDWPIVCCRAVTGLKYVAAR